MKLSTETAANKYAAYLETPEGRLRTDLTFANLQEFLPQAKQSLRALDLGGGTGTATIRLARLGVQVTLLDCSPAMLDLAQRAAQQAGVAEKITLRLGDVTQLAALFTGASFDVILCHNLLEYMDDPPGVLCRAVPLMRDSSAILSVLVRNQAGEVLKAAIQAGDLDAAEDNLTAEWGQESLYGGRLRLFTGDALHAIVKTASLNVAACRGVRVIADYLPPNISREVDYDRIFQLERKLGSRPEFNAVARYTHCIAHRPNPILEHQCVNKIT